MPIPDKHTKDNKEIRLFGEKSLREEAYRQKIIELEKEVMKLEAVLKDQKNPEEIIPAEENTEKDIFYAAVVSLEERVKKHLHTIEAKARHVSEKINSEAQNLSEQKRSDRYATTNKKVFIALSLFTLLALMMGTFGIFAFFSTRARGVRLPTEQGSTILLRQALQKNSFYSNQYTIISLNYYNNIYKGIIELHFKPQSNWSLKIIASDIIENFKNASPGKSIELNFIYEDNTYAKINYSPVLNETHFEFK